MKESLDVELSDDPRALAAGRAMATWAWAKVYTLAHGLGGFIPRVAVGASWVGRAQGLKDMAVLAGPAVALITEVDGGWELVVDSETDTSSTRVDDAKSPGAIRAKRYRDNLKKARIDHPSSRDERDASRVTKRDGESDPSRDASRSLARSPSSSLYDSASSSRLLDHPDSLPCANPEADPLTDPPAWRDEQVKAVEVWRGKRPVDVEHCWGRFVTVSRRDVRAITPEAWKAFVVMQLGWDAQEARKNPNRVRAIQRDERPPAYEKATAEDHEAHLDELIEESRKKGATGS